MAPGPEEDHPLLLLGLFFAVPISKWYHASPALMARPKPLYDTIISSNDKAGAIRKDMHNNQCDDQDQADGWGQADGQGNGQGAALPDLPGIRLTLPPLSRSPVGTVYKGWDSVHRCAVVVKMQRGAADTVAADRFRREAAVMARLRHPNIVTLYRFYEGDPSALVMEYVPGRTLAELVEAGGPLAPARVAGIIEGVAAALDRIHLEGIVHRDVKPSNILLPPRGGAKLTDFGVAHTDEGNPLTVLGDILGTIEYVSPEQIHGETTPDARSDVYSLAAVAYFALVGMPPFPAADNSTQAQLSIMHRQVFSPPPPMQRPGLSAELEAAVLCGLAKAPDARPASAGQFAAGLRSAVEVGSGVPEASATAAATRRMANLAGAVAGAALLLLGGIATWKAEQPGQPAGPSPHPSGHAPVAAAPVRVAVAASLQERHPASRLVHKALVTERPHFRRHPNVVARAPSLPQPAAKPVRPLVAAAHTPAVQGQAWPSVPARQNSTAVPARTVTVDGRPLPSLASSGWATLPAGKHLGSYIPDPSSGFSPNPGLRVTLASGAHVTRQILLPLSHRPLVAAVQSSKPAAAEAPKPVAAAEAPNPAAVAATPAALAATPAALAATPAAVGWYTVSGWGAPLSAASKSGLARVSAQWVKVDGQPIPGLALGQWATLPAGKHSVTLQPTPSLGLAAKTWDIDLMPQGHLDQKIPLTPARLPELQRDKTVTKRAVR